VEYVRASDGLLLACEHFGDEASPTLVFAHGFGQTRHAWEDAANVLAGEGWHCVTTDARGHGGSGRRDDGEYHYDQFIDDLLQLTRATASVSSGRLPILIGASMGGLLGLSAQARYAPFRALVLVDITPRWEAAGVARILTFMRAHPDGFATFDEAADAIAAYLPHRAEYRRSGQDRPERLRKLLIAGDDGRLRWHWDPRLLDYVAAESEQQQDALLDAARCIRVPTLLISGERSDIVSASSVAEFLRHVPHAKHVCVEKATHMVAGDSNDAFARAVLDFVQPLNLLPLPQHPRITQ
jgi:pimeloyl-ACP methyl ester carboxylesterase